MAVRIILADDHKIIREGLRALVARLPGSEVVAEASDGLAAVDAAIRLKPDLVIMDVGMPGLNGIEATRQIKAHSKSIQVIALSMHSDSRFVSGMLEAGASGYLPKDSAFEELARAIHSVIAGHIYLSPSITGPVVTEYVGRRAGSAGPGRALTDRERTVLQLVAEGWSTKKIADRLKVSTKTVETHRQQIMEKLNLRSVAELTKYAVREGLTSL